MGKADEHEPNMSLSSNENDMDMPQRSEAKMISFPPIKNVTENSSVPMLAMQSPVMPQNNLVPAYGYGI